MTPQRLLVAALFAFLAAACVSHDDYATGCHLAANKLRDFACMVPNSATEVSVTQDRSRGIAWLRFYAPESLPEVRESASVLGFVRESDESVAVVPTLLLKGLGRRREEVSEVLETWVRHGNDLGPKATAVVDPHSGWIFIYGQPREPTDQRGAAVGRPGSGSVGLW